MSYFAYRALTPYLPSIWLVRLHPRATHAPSMTSAARQPSEMPQPSVACTIFHVSLDHPLPYFALSYTWGDVHQKGCILVHGSPFYVTKSLETALIHLTPDDAPLTLWIDALCIDQNDEVEKAEQVRKMHRIYSHATSVITWLGPATETSDAAMSWIQCYGSLAHNLGIGTKPELQFRPLLQAFQSNPSKLPHKGFEEFLRGISNQLSPPRSGGADNVVTALYELFTRSYWSRIWVVQELTYGKCVRVVCGKMSVSEELLHHSLKLLRNFAYYEHIKLGQSPLPIKLDLGSAALGLRNPIDILKTRRATGPFLLIYLIRTFRYFEATDPRDRIFALLSFAEDAAALGIKPDYQKSCREVYVETTRSLISKCFFDILSLCQVHNNIPELPSWVPDFASISQRVPLQQRAMDRKAVPLTTGFLDSGSAVFEPDDLKDVWRTAVADQEISQGDQKPRLSRKELDKVHELLKGLDLSAVDEKVLVALGLGDYTYQLQDVARGRRPFSTENGHIGIGPDDMELGDLLYILIGAQVPYTLRPNTHGRLHLVGEVYANGIMDGEYMDDE
ncbi:Folylpolyglutamate synthetase [Fusarium chlamydosporum]